jgi:hypothetical protein
MTTEQFEWVIDSLANDEFSSNEELIQYFQDEFKLKEEDSKHWVNVRTHFIGKIIYKPTTP